MEAQDSPDLKTALKQWSVEKEAEGPLASYQSVLFGGDKQRGHAIFYEHTSAQCVRCHSIWEYGGTAGPDLNKLNDRMDEQSILESLILPSAKIAKGYAVASLELVDGKTIGGMILEEDAQNIKLKVGIGDIQDIAKSKIKDRTDIPSSMPAVNNLLNKKEIRDLMAFLKTL
jgi:putative heme-binding domain-containing protein